MKIKVFISSVALACASIGLAACADSDADIGEAVAPLAALPVVVADAQRATIQATYTTTATLEADSEAPILARVAGEVIEIVVEEGDAVVTGQVLARLDGERLALRARKAKAEYDNAARELARFANLNEQRAISRAAFEDLQYRADALKARYELERLNANYTDIRATISGYVAERNITVGSSVRAGQQVFRISDAKRLVAHLAIPQTELHKFSSGDAVNVSVDSAPDVSFHAAIERLSPTIDTSTGTFRATVYFDNRNGELAPGMFGRFVVAYEEHEQAVVVPTTAVVYEDNATVVYVVEDGTAVRRRIETGIQGDGYIEVTSGLQGVETIITTGQTQLQHGSRVLASAGRPETGFSG